MSNAVGGNSIEDIRTNIDQVDRRIVALLAERGGYVKQAARFKRTNADVKVTEGAEETIAKVTALSRELGANPAVTEKVYRAMIVAFINAELAAHSTLTRG